MCTVVNKYKSEFDVYIGRGSMWGNPFITGTHGTRDEVIEMYGEYLAKQIMDGKVTVEQLQALHGKRLGCFCKPKSCHGDKIKEIVLLVS
jgi:hypothetical protein